jgi:hypothetical protein
MKSKIYIIIGMIVIGFALSFLYSQTVVSGMRQRFEERREMVGLIGNRVKVDFDLPQDAYLLKIKHIIQENQSKEIFVNGSPVDSDAISYVRKRGIIETNYIKLSKETINPGRNTIEIYFPQNRPPDVGIELSNYRKEINKDIYILFFDSANLPTGVVSLKTVAFPVFLAFLFFGGMIYLLTKVFSLKASRPFLYQVYSIIPFLIFLSSLWIFNNSSGVYRVIISPNYFWTFGLVSFAITEGSIVTKKLLQGYRRKDFSIVRPKVNPCIIKAFNWLKTREFSDKCVLLFMALLIICAFLLLLHLEPVAEQLANIAYIALVAGVVIKFVKMVREERSNK